MSFLWTSLVLAKKSFKIIFSRLTDQLSGGILKLRRFMDQSIKNLIIIFIITLITIILIAGHQIFHMRLHLVEELLVKQSHDDAPL